MEQDITCQWLIGVLADYLAGELGAADESRCRLHLDACADCARYLEDYQATIRLIRDALRD
ncbi:MAG TPA: zf-HC2 domain-containing protein [Candidatus Limnocylindrales bacterium]|nr:zf-HC2 domain-containing protein [Candidatus Limnocylindrales bacterium]